MKSFRLRLLVGSLLWTLALLGLAHMLFLLVVFHVFPFYNQIVMLCAVLIMSAGAMVVSSALAPFTRLRARLLELRDGRSQTIAGHYPNEIQPLVDDLNALLEQRERAVRRAQAKAGDLAHGLKTPLAILAQEAESAHRQGHAELAAILLQQVERMRRQIEYHLAQARAGSARTPGVRSSVRDSVEALTRTINRLYADRGLSFEMNVPEQRGVRADETTPGTGLGLAIVRELVELYVGSISLGDSARGGLQVNLSLPGL